MKSYIKGNKAAWEDAYAHKQDDFEKDIIVKLRHAHMPYVHNHLKEALQSVPLKNQMIGQFCSNNGRELLSLRNEGIKGAIGFDIAKNMVDFANDVAEKLNDPIKFVEINILDIGDEYNEMFDVVIITIGALCWFEDLHAFFKVVSKTMKQGATIIIHEGHPYYNLLATPDEHNFNSAYPQLPVNDYFKKTPWTSESGMSYMTKDYVSKAFTSFSHTFEAILNALTDHHIMMTKIKEFDLDIANLFPHLNHKGLPLSFLYMGIKKT